MAKVLVIDDAYFVRLNVRTFLESKGFEVAEAENGLLALEVYNDFMPDVVLCDITMPVMDGVSFLKNLFKSHPTAKVVMLTSTSDSSVISETLAIGAKNFLTKPFNPEVALETIEAILNA